MISTHALRKIFVPGHGRPQRQFSNHLPGSRDIQVTTGIRALAQFPQPEETTKTILRSHGPILAAGSFVTHGYQFGGSGHIPLGSNATSTPSRESPMPGCFTEHSDLRQNWQFYDFVRPRPVNGRQEWISTVVADHVAALDWLQISSLPSAVRQRRQCLQTIKWSAGGGESPSSGSFKDLSRRLVIGRIRPPEQGGFSADARKRKPSSFRHR